MAATDHITVDRAAEILGVTLNYVLGLIAAQELRARYDERSTPTLRRIHVLEWNATRGDRAA